jgi:flavin-dependent dehydrogenase
MASGEIAAGVALDALTQGDTSERFLSKYEKLCRNDFGRDLKLLGYFNRQWGKQSERFVRLLTLDNVFAKLVVGVTGGRISFSEYKWKIVLRFVYVYLKDLFTRRKS